MKETYDERDKLGRRKILMSANSSCIQWNNYLTESSTTYWPQLEVKNVASKAMSEIEYTAPDSITMIRIGDSVCDLISPDVRCSAIQIFPAIRPKKTSV